VIHRFGPWRNLRAKRDKAAARCLFERAIDQKSSPETVTIDKSGANLAALNAVDAERETSIKVHQIKYLNNIVEQDHRAIYRPTRPMLGFNDFNCARVILSGIELMHMIKKRQVKCSGRNSLAASQKFYSLVS
jgi:putative transposase